MRRIYPVLSDLEDVYRRATNTSASPSFSPLTPAFRRSFFFDPALGGANSLPTVKPAFATYNQPSPFAFSPPPLLASCPCIRTSAELDFLRSIGSINGVLPTSARILPVIFEISSVSDNRRRTEATVASAHHVFHLAAAGVTDQA